MATWTSILTAFFLHSYCRNSASSSLIQNLSWLINSSTYLPYSVNRESNNDRGIGENNCQPENILIVKPYHIKCKENSIESIYCDVRVSKVKLYLKSVGTFKEKKMDVTTAIPSDSAIRWPTVVTQTWYDTRTFLKIKD